LLLLLDDENDADDANELDDDELEPLLDELDDDEPEYHHQPHERELVLELELALSLWKVDE
jgi:hypothetical protein